MYIAAYINFIHQIWSRSWKVLFYFPIIFNPGVHLWLSQCNKITLTLEKVVHFYYKIILNVFEK